MKRFLLFFTLIASSAFSMENEKYIQPSFTHAYLHEGTAGKTQIFQHFTLRHNENKTATITHENDAEEIISIKDNSRITRSFASSRESTSEDVLVLDIL
ncbi:TPA: hypothetical protein DIC20_00725 [Candidatus Dependentiae bacterium]|nr:MAG: hypothetical protein US03_C0002G0007 [candidate division TM6 bacterium GW2011_GWF2_36_131]KKQ03441.1 MAG: hypothetical protein US13_C0002G0007 [candidate division TM6 bacterium GW2011_GWE2_36_25]KKQ20285.1 MAG: hypothetical protein US32_C0001G0182 [candidate division TM6 bacterium GW2011_GWA2_36_9]HBR70825.1 hypothetical protein [Candidatus Dependentiae bacterium]HCU00210.1 hypothetical protein [Candidatus Dependentiae bacterium]